MSVIARDAPLGEELEALAETAQGAMPDAVLGASVEFGELTLHVRADKIVEVLFALRDNAMFGGFQQLTDICSVHWPDRDKPFDVVYHLLDHMRPARLRLVARVDSETGLPSCVKVFANADWFEREIFDMHGVPFDGHPYLRRLLTDYGFEGHPLRKDFPLTGYVEVRYDDEQKRVIYEPVKLTQAYRDFDFLSPWEGIQEGIDGVLPGDEKSGQPADQSTGKSGGESTDASSGKSTGKSTGKSGD